MCALTIHFTNASIANPTMMRKGRFEGLALTAHAQFLRPSLGFRRDGGRWHTSRIRQGCLDVRGQCQTAQNVITNGKINRNATRLCQKGNGQGRVAQQYPYKNSHDCPSRVGLIQPNSMFICRSSTAGPCHVVEIISIIKPVRPLLVSKSPRAANFGAFLKQGSSVERFLFLLVLSKTCGKPTSKGFQMNGCILITQKGTNMSRGRHCYTNFGTRIQWTTTTTITTTIPCQ
jgi:hypothetical protein